MTVDSQVPLAERKNCRATWQEVSMKGPRQGADTVSHSNAVHVQNRPMHTILVPRRPVMVEDCESRADWERFKSLETLAKNALHKCRKEPIMFNRNLPALPTQKYHCKLIKQTSLTPPVGRPLSGPPQLVNMLRDPLPAALPNPSCKKRCMSPITVHYGGAHVSVRKVERGVYREMSPDEKLFIEAAAALSHVETGEQPRPVAKKPKQQGMPPPPFSLQQPR